MEDVNTILTMEVTSSRRLFLRVPCISLHPEAPQSGVYGAEIWHNPPTNQRKSGKPREMDF